MARKPRSRKPKVVQEDTNVELPHEHAERQVPDAPVEEGRQEEGLQSEEEILASALINLGHNEVYSEAQARVKKLTKAERAMLLERVSKPPE